MAFKDPAQKYAYNNAWAAENRERITILVQKGEKEKIRERAERNGESVNVYINRLIKEDMSKTE